MKRVFILASAFLPLVNASIGERLPQFVNCLANCNEKECVLGQPFLPENDVNPFAKALMWPCGPNCNYKCREHVTDLLRLLGQLVVQFEGKWPFRRVFGVTEFFSAFFSALNLYVNYAQLVKIHRHSLKVLHSKQSKVILRQYTILLCVSIFGWLGSVVFHIRDIPATETWDYFGAGAIIAANFNAIFVRYFNLFQDGNVIKRNIFQGILVLVLIVHYKKLYSQWDYSYNMRYNIALGLTSSLLWVLHSLKVYSTYASNAHFYNNSIQLLPFENRILTKLSYIGNFRSRYIPLVPLGLNIFLVISLFLETIDFPPWLLLIDAHSLWHLATIFPPLIWYDWNIWDVEMSSLSRVN